VDAMTALSRQRALIWVMSACVVGVLWFPGVASAAVSQWTVQQTPRVPGPGYYVLGGVSCMSSAACIAVGSHSLSGELSGQPIAERWNGRRWSLQRTPKLPRGNQNTLNGVACISGTSCIAVGSSMPLLTNLAAPALVEWWNGRTWSIEHVPSAGATERQSFNSVACPSKTACFAVGNWYDVTGGSGGQLFERWNGSRWSIESSAGTHKSVEFNGISCTSASACTAVGADSNTGAVSYRWNGRRWSLQKNPPMESFGGGFPEFDAVSCASSRACAAVGQASTCDGSGCEAWSLAEFWNGERWGDLSAPGTYDPGGADNALLGVSCPSATACLAVGSKVQLWDGRRWSKVKTTFSISGLTGVSCSSNRSCEVVGAPASGNRPFAARWTS
jgi:hypothetical protein